MEHLNMAMAPETGYTTFAQRSAVTGTACNPPAARPSTVPSTAPQTPTAGEELKWLDGELGTLHAQLDILEKKLEAVLTPPYHAADSDEGETVSPRSPLVLKVRDDRNILDSANRRLGRILDRIEL